MMAVDRPHDSVSLPAADLVCEGPDGSSRQGEPVTCGVPWPRGVLNDVGCLSLYAEGGQPVLLQARALNRWPGGSVRWALLDWLASKQASSPARYRVIAGPGPGRADPAAQPVVMAESQNGSVSISTGRTTFRLTRGRFPFESVEQGGVASINPGRTGLEVEDGDGRRYACLLDEVALEEAGPVRATVRMTGHLVGESNHSLCELIARLHFFAGSATVRFVLTLRNPRAAGHPGGCWDLGARGSIYFKKVAFAVCLPDGGRQRLIRYSPEPEAPYETAAGDLEIYQDSSGGDNWRSLNHVNRRREIPLTFRGYRLSVNGQERRGLRATPAISIEAGPHCVSAAMHEFWQNFPKSLEVAGDTLILGLFPPQFADVHELQGGEQKTHVFHLAFGPDSVTPAALDWCRCPLVAHASPEWYCSTGAVPYLGTKATCNDTAYEALVNAAIEGCDSFDRKREIIDEYGWRHFGGLYADHESLHAGGPKPTISHYNNQYDGILGCGLQFMRSGDARWLRQMRELAGHVIDIDVYHTSGDKSAYNHGMFWHTAHYMHADTSTHRTYPARYSSGGGPNAGHLYTSGLVLGYFLSGDALARETVIDCGQYIIDADDGRLTVLRWVDNGFTGNVTESGPGYHGPGRASGNAISALVNAHMVSGETRFLEKAEQLIRRCIHPQDEPAALNLLDAESRWFYTLFLQAVGRYLDYKAELGELDGMYGYALESLLSYARWMTDHEYPYLEKPEILEYPTETWAAQDMRKSDVFAFAARHASGQWRERFLERCEFFFRASAGTVSNMETRTLARPVVLLLSNGLMYLYLRGHGSERAPSPDEAVVDFGRPERFVPQKVRAMRKLSIAGAAGVAGCAGLAAILLTWLR